MAGIGPLELAIVLGRWRPASQRCPRSLPLRAWGAWKVAGGVSVARAGASQLDDDPVDCHHAPLQLGQRPPKTERTAWGGTE